ncbi:hypothetical protein MCOR31_011932, partial [Pyricularia oryzae]
MSWERAPPGCGVLPDVDGPAGGGGLQALREGVDGQRDAHHRRVPAGPGAERQGQGV